MQDTAHNGHTHTAAQVLTANSRSCSRTKDRTILPKAAPSLAEDLGLCQKALLSTLPFAQNKVEKYIDQWKNHKCAARLMMIRTKATAS
eukprot:132644-Pelagomonas_calceolata.AAC.8